MFARVYRASTFLGGVHDQELPRTTIRFLKYVIVWLITWQDTFVEGSIVQLSFYTGSTKPVSTVEVFLTLAFMILVMERLITGDYKLKRSYFFAPVLLIGLAFFFSWVRGMWIRQEVVPVYEIHEAFLLPFEFFIFSNLLREKHEWRVIVLLVILGSLGKTLDGLVIFLFSPSPVKGWGVLQSWRDGYLLGLAVICTALLLHYRGTLLRWLRRTMLISLPIVIFVLIVSYRRTFFVAIIIALLAMFVTVGKGKRMNHFMIFVFLLVGLLGIIIVTDPIGFIGRMFAVVNPNEEGSAYIRLMELPNVLMNIYHNPILGTAIGVPWHQYYRMPIFANYTALGTHNSYLYWPLRGGLMATIGFWWMIGRMWRVIALQFRFCRDNEDDNFLAQTSFFMMMIYMVGSFFGLMYGDAVSVLLALHLTSLQLFIEDKFGVISLKDVAILPTLRDKTLYFRKHLSERLRLR